VRQLARELEGAQKEKGLVMSVGYMLRYSPAVVMAKRLLEAVRLRPFFVLYPSV
jgi:predicted dehydrogenase